MPEFPPDDLWAAERARRERMRPVHEVMRDVLADADLSITVHAWMPGDSSAENTTPDRGAAL